MDLVKNIINYLLPLCNIAGQYAAEIQNRVQAQTDKQLDHDSPFTAALTDADLSVQGFIEVALLAKFPDIEFYGEEEASSLNTKYFSKKNGLKILLDPIDGTLFYKNKLPYFSVIASIINSEEMLATIIFQPKTDRCFVAIKGLGLRLLNSQEMSSSDDILSKGKIIKFSDADNPPKRVLLYKCLDAKEKLKDNFEAIDLSIDFTYEQNWQHETVGILYNTHVAYLSSHAQLLDTMPIAFAAQEAGAVMSDLGGQKLDFQEARTTGLYKNLIVARNENIHSEILKIIAK